MKVSITRLGNVLDYPAYDGVEEEEGVASGRSLMEFMLLGKTQPVLFSSIPEPRPFPRGGAGWERGKDRMGAVLLAGPCGKLRIPQ